MSFTFNKTEDTDHVYGYHLVSKVHIDVVAQVLHVVISSYKDLTAKNNGARSLDTTLSYSASDLPASILTDITSLVGTIETAIQSLPDWS